MNGPVQWEEHPLHVQGGRFTRPVGTAMSYHFLPDSMGTLHQVPVHTTPWLQPDQVILMRDPGTDRVEIYAHPLRFIEMFATTLDDRIEWTREWFHGEAERRFSAVRLP